MSTEVGLAKFVPLTLLYKALEKDEERWMMYDALNQDFILKLCHLKWCGQTG